MKKYHYQLYIAIDHEQGYSIAVESTQPLKDGEAMNLAAEQDLYYDTEDKYLVEKVTPIDEVTYLKHFCY